MALQEYAGAMALEVDGKEIEVIDLAVNTKTGRKLVKTMNRSGRAKGYSKGVAEYSLDLTVAIPLSGDIDWEAVDKAKLTIYPATGDGQRESYLDCFVIEIGNKFTVDSEGRRTLKLQSLRRVIE